MNQNQLQSNDMDVLFEIENVIDSLALATQKSISMTKLNVALKEAFAEPMEMLEKLGELFEKISDETIHLVAMRKIIVALNEFESKLSII